MHPLRNFVLFVGRVLISGVFVFDATIMIRSLDNVAAMIAGAGLPYASYLAIAAAIGQFVGGVMILFGLWTRLASWAFAGFCIATALLFHRNLASNSEVIQMGKDLAIAGGFLFLAVEGPGAWALDRRRVYDDP